MHYLSAILALSLLLFPCGSVEPTPEAEPEIVEEIMEEIIIIEEPVTYNYMGEFTLTAFCPCVQCSGDWGTMTSTGTTAQAGRTIAVDPSVIPYGSEVIINGNTYVAEDCGGGIKSKRIDVYFDTHQEALNFGVQSADVYVKGVE